MHDILISPTSANTARRRARSAPPKGYLTHQARPRRRAHEPRNELPPPHQLCSDLNRRTAYRGLGPMGTGGCGQGANFQGPFSQCKRPVLANDFTYRKAASYTVLGGIADMPVVAVYPSFGSVMDGRAIEERHFEPFDFLQCSARNALQVAV
jgi:hypothetical protein